MSSPANLARVLSFLLAGGLVVARAPKRRQAFRGRRGFRSGGVDFSDGAADDAAKDLESGLESRPVGFREAV